MGSAHVTSEGLAVSENLSTSLANELAVPLLLYNFRLRHLRLLVRLLNIFFDGSAMDDLFARGALGH